MFQYYHKYLKKYDRVLFGFLLVVIVVSFVLSGVAGSVGDGGDGAVKDVAIETPLQSWTRPEFDRLVFRWKHALMGRGNMFLSYLMEHGGQLYAGDPKKNLYAYALGGGDTREMDRELASDICAMIGAAKQAGMRVTEPEVTQRVKDTLSFGGGFDREKYAAILTQMEMTAGDYEQTVGEYILVGKYLTLLESGVSAATQDVFDEFIKTGGRAKAKYVAFNNVTFRKQARTKVSQKSLVDYLRSFKASPGFRKEPQARLEFIRVPIEPLKAAIKEDPTEAELEAYYASHKEEFRRPIFTCELPPSDRLFLPATMIDRDVHSDDDGHDHSEHEKPSEDAYKPFKDVRTELIDKVKTQKASEQAAEIMGKVKDRVFELRMQGVAKPAFTDLAKEFNLEAPGTSAWFEEDDVKGLDEQLGIPKAGSPQWYTFFNEKIETARSTPVRTDKADLIVRLVEKTDGTPYLATSHIREKGVAKCADRDAGLLARKESDAILQEYKSRYEKAYGDKVTAGAKLTDDELATLRYDTFTTLCAERKLEVKETEYVTRNEQIQEIADWRPFLQSLFEIEARGDARVAYGNSGQYLVQLVQKRPPKATDFTAKRQQLQAQILRQKQGRFVTDALEQFKKENCKFTLNGK